jgi:hypothetical protein
MEKRDLTRLLGWPGYRVYRYEVDEAAKTLKIWVRKKPVHRGFECSGCGRRVHAVVGTWERVRIPSHGNNHSEVMKIIVPR